eukprot:642336-Rhodomonas_salina.1
MKGSERRASGRMGPGSENARRCVREALSGASPCLGRGRPSSLDPQTHDDHAAAARVVVDDGEEVGVDGGEVRADSRQRHGLSLSRAPPPTRAA